PDRLTQPTLATTVHVTLAGLADRCSGDQLASTELAWKLDGQMGPAGNTVTAVQAAPREFYAELPLTANTKELYQIRIGFADGSTLALPDNLADPYYQVYEGRTVPLYCTDFEDGDPLAAGWTTATKSGMPSPWSWGVPSSGATDPHAAFSGTHVLALA